MRTQHALVLFVLIAATLDCSLGIAGDADSKMVSRKP
jgi:hypothetical protein